MKTFLRFLRRNPIYTIINIAGLAVALMFVILIGDYTWRQYSVDSGQPNKDRVFMLGSTSEFFTWQDISHEIGNLYPEIEKTCCVVSQGGTIRSDAYSHEDEEGNIMLLADSTFFSMFKYEFIEGDSKDAMSSPDKCVITQSLANSLFPGHSPIGEALRLVGERAVTISDGRPDPYDSTLTYTVSGVIEDFDKTIFPSETAVIANLERHPQILGFRIEKTTYVSTGHGCLKTFFMAHEGADIGSRADEIKSYILESIGGLKAFSSYGGDGEVTFTPLRKVMFAPQNNDPGLKSGDKKLLSILLSAILAILFFAVTNYVNLTTANTGTRAKEMATRQLLGSRKNEIVAKLIGESILMVLIAFLIGLGLAFAFENELSAMFRGDIILRKDISPDAVALCAAFVVVTGLAAGLIPGIQMSAFKPIDIVKGSFRYRSKMVFSKIFIITQYFITVVMLTVSLVIALQIRGLVNAPIGLNSEDLAFVYPSIGEADRVLSTLRELPCVERIGVSSGSCLLPGSKSIMTKKDANGDYQLIFTATLDKEAMELYGVNIIEKYGPSIEGTYVNEKFLETMSVPDGAREIQWQDGGSEILAGVIKDFHTGNILDTVSPFMITVEESGRINNQKYPRYLVKTDGSREAVSRIREAISAVTMDKSDMDWTVQDLGQNIEDQFYEHKNTLRVILMFTVIALLISILGLIGMSLFFIRQRRGEIAVRRIMGESTDEVLALMLAKFCAPLLVSCVAAVPVAWYIADRWLQDFSWRISLSAWMFIATCAIALMVAVLSVLWQTLAAVRRNPSESIKTE